MASFRKNKAGKWEAQVARKGIRRGGTFESKAEAVQWAGKVEAEILDGKKGAADKTFGDLMARYLEEVSPLKSSREGKRVALMLKGWIAKVPLKDLAPSHSARWRDERIKSVSGGTVCRDMATMSAAIKVAIREWGWMDSNPVSGVALPKPNPARDRRITRAEIDRIIAMSGYDHGKPETIRQRTCAAFLFAIETGMRNQEIATLTMDRVFLDKRYVHIPGSLTKTGEKRDVPLSAEAIRIIQQMDVSEGRVFGMDQLQIVHTFYKLKKECLLDDLTFHDARHEAVTRLAKKLDVMALSRVIGHKNINQLMTYYNETAENLADLL